LAIGLCGCNGDQTPTVTSNPSAPKANIADHKPGEKSNNVMPAPKLNHGGDKLVGTNAKG